MIASNYNVIAVMSGTSFDGIDIICVNFSYSGNWDFKILNSETVFYSSEWKSILSQLVTMSMDELNKIDALYSEYLGHQILEFITENKFEAIDFIASHGHTALHQPEKGLTYQIGNQQILANIIGEKVICDFRVQDVKLGGQGAPLVPIGDRLLFSDFEYCLNLGGFANISFEKDKTRIAYDICPVNIVLNHYVSKLNLDYDDKGQIASKGSLNEDLLKDLNALNFYKLKPPKSLGLEWVEQTVFPLIDKFKLQTETILRTFVEHIAIQISENLYLKNSQLLITGGGAYNDFLISRIKHFSKVEIVIPTKEIIEFKEALIFGLLGVLKDENEVNCLMSVTGAEKDHSSGKILMPKNHV